MDMNYVPNQMMYGNGFNNGIGGYGYQQPFGNPYPGYSMYGVSQFMNAPQQHNVLTNEEIALIRNSRGDSVLDLNISNEDFLRGICSHRDERGQDATYELQDGSGRIGCRICGAVWDGTKVPKEEAASIVDRAHSLFQNIKWIGGVPNSFIREYAAMLPLFMKLSKIYNISLDNYQKTNGFGFGEYDVDNSILRQFNALNGRFNNMGGYMPPNPAYGYYQQPMMGSAIQPANPSINPMQAAPTPQNAFGGVAPQPYSPAGYQAAPQMAPQPFNPGFMPQPQLIMPGYGAAPQPYNAVPQLQAPQAYNAVQSAPVPQAPAAPQAAPVEKKTEAVTL